MHLQISEHVDFVMKECRRQLLSGRMRKEYEIMDQEPQKQTDPVLDFSRKGSDKWAEQLLNKVGESKTI